MAYHDHVDPHRLEVARRVDQRLALGYGRAARRDVHRVGRQPLLREFERDAGARRCFKEEVDDRLAAQRGHLLDRALGDFLERFGGVENEPDLLGGHVLEPGEILAEGRGSGHRIRSTWSRPSSSSTCTSTRSPGTVFTAFPTTSA